MRKLGVAPGVSIHAVYGPSLSFAWEQFENAPMVINLTIKIPETLGLQDVELPVLIDYQGDARPAYYNLAKVPDSDNELKGARLTLRNISNNDKY